MQTYLHGMIADIANLVELVPHPAGAVGYRAIILGVHVFDNVLIPLFLA